MLYNVNVLRKRITTTPSTWTSRAAWPISTGDDARALKAWEPVGSYIQKIEANIHPDL